MDLRTPWSEGIDFQNVLTEYPRMQLQRDSFQCLNGIWDYQITAKETLPDEKHWKKINVPFALGTPLSGTDEILEPGQWLWYRCQFAYKPNKKETWLNFEGVDQNCTVWINGIEVGSHEGGYSPFSINISGEIKYQNALQMCVQDHSDTGLNAYGKQRLKHGGMWYTPTAGIYGTVWLEDLNKHAVQDIKYTPDFENKTMRIDLAGDFTQAYITVAAEGKVIHKGLTGDSHYVVPLKDMHAWSPEDPFLYDVYIQTEDDMVKSYFGMRSFTSKRDARGISRFCLNDQPLFLNGLLDQGYLPESGMTYPSEEAMKEEILSVKNLGYNMVRKHAKTESRRWYYLCDTLGLLVMQDIPSGGNYYYTKMTVLPNFGIVKRDDTREDLGRSTAQSQDMYYHELDGILDNLYNAVCVFAWVPFNEGWGQFNAKEVTDYIRRYDETRLIDSTSGWFDQGCGDFHSLHYYFVPFHVPKKKDDRILILSECGGYSYLEWGHSAPKELYGYKTFRDKVKLNDAILSFYRKRILANIEKGLSGCIYTQLSDIEDECNGMYTADRRILKVDAGELRHMNQRCARRLKNE